MEVEDEVLEKPKKFSKIMPHLKDGRIDYHNTKKAFVVTCFSRYNNEIKPLREKALKDLYEETRIAKEKVKKITTKKYIF